MKQRKTDYTVDTGAAQSSAPAAALTTPRELARLISWHEESVRRAIRAGRIKALNVGRGLRIPATELARILTEGIAAA